MGAPSPAAPDPLLRLHAPQPSYGFTGAPEPRTALQRAPGRGPRKMEAVAPGAPAQPQRETRPASFRRDQPIETRRGRMTQVGRSQWWSLSAALSVGIG